MYHSSFEFLDHRPWELPKQNWQWRQSWTKLAFIHYKVDFDNLRALVPKKFDIDLFEGEAWVSIVPFFMEDVMHGNLPSVYPFRQFPELNLRTYVVYDGKPGVFFFSLDAQNIPIVLMGNLLYGIPYKYSRMRYEVNNSIYVFKSKRLTDNVKFEATIEVLGEEYSAKEGSLEEWLSERYCFYSTNLLNNNCRVEIHHKKWPLQKCKINIIENELLSAVGLNVDEDSVLCNFSSGVDVVSFKAEKLV